MRPGVILTTVAVVQFLAPLDPSIVNVALLQIGVGLGFTAVGLTWVINAYALTIGGLLLVGAPPTALTQAVPKRGIPIVALV